jgi:6-phosphogluconolactonase
LLDTRLLVLHIEGEAKRKVLQAALAGGEGEHPPVRAVLTQTRTPVTVYWSP